jgi:hypothetical protein
MMNSFYEHKNIQTYTWSACNCKTVIACFIANWRLSNLFLYERIYRGSYTGSDHFLVLAKLRFPTK